MKCIYAIHLDASESAKELAEQYTQALARLSDDVIVLGDDLRAFAETRGAAALKLDDDDWAAAINALSAAGDCVILGEIFWSAHAAFELLGGDKNGAVEDNLFALWLEGQVRRRRSFLLLSN